MQHTHRGITLVALKCFSLMCQAQFAGGGTWRCERREDKNGFPLFDVTTTFYEEEQVMQTVLGYVNGVE